MRKGRFFCFFLNGGEVSAIRIIYKELQVLKFEMGWSLSCFFLLIFIEMFLKSDAKKMRGFPSKRSSKAVFKVPTRYSTSPDSLKSNHAKPCLIGTMDARHFRQILRKCQASFRRQHQFWNVLILQAHGPPRWLWRFYKTSMWSLAAKKTAGWFAEPGMLGRCFEANSTWCTSAEWEFTVRGLGPTIDSDWGGASGGPKNITYHPNVLYS